MSVTSSISGCFRNPEVVRFGYILRLFVLPLVILGCVFPANVSIGQSDGEGNRTTGLSPFEQAELLRLIDLDIRNLSKIPVQGVL